MSATTPAEITDEMVAAAWEAAREEGIQSPYMARIADFQNDLEGLRAADREADQKNDDAMRRVLAAALAVRRP